MFDCWYQVSSTLIVGLSVLSVGATVGWTNPAIKKLKKNGSITNAQSSWIASFHEIGHFLSPLPCAYAHGKVGRKVILFFAAAIMTFGWVLVMTIHSIEVLYFVRFLFGLGMGIVFTTVPLYIGEIAEPHLRGALSTSFQAMLYLGHVLEFSAGPYISYNQLNIVSFVISLLFLIFGFFMIESPHFLVSVNKREEAKASLQKLRKSHSEHQINLEMAIIHEIVEVHNYAEGVCSKMRKVFSKPYRFNLAIIVFVAIAQRFTGMSAVVAYAATTFPSTNAVLTADVYTIIFGVIVFGFTFVATSLVDFAGRRPLMLVSCIGCFVCHLITGVYFSLSPSTATWLPFVSITAFAILYSIGIGPLPNTLQGELFPLSVKGVASGLMTLAHAASSFVVTKLFQVIRDAYGIQVNFYIFSISCLISSVIAFCFVPETKKKHLQELCESENVD